jgi:ketosteroid isomerase-like protein
MKIFLVLALLLLPSLAVFPQSKAEREVADTVRQWADLMVSRDMDTLGRILADDIVITDYTARSGGRRKNSRY